MSDDEKSARNVNSIDIGQENCPIELLNSSIGSLH